MTLTIVLVLTFLSVGLGFCIGLWIGMHLIRSMDSNLTELFHMYTIKKIADWFRAEKNQDYIIEEIAPHHSNTKSLINRLGDEIEIQFLKN